VLLGGLAALLLLTLLVPFTARQLYWLAESERFMEETADPVVVDFASNGAPDRSQVIPRDTWAAGDTIYVRRSICVYKQVTGTLERSIVDTAQIPIDVVPLSSLIYLDAAAFDDKGRPTRPPWCGQRILSVTIPAFMSPGAVYVRARVDAHLNPLKPHVFLTLRPARFMIVSSPIRAELEATQRRAANLREMVELRIALLAGRLDLLLERFRDAELAIQKLQAFQRRTEGAPRP
jgi:hypothetical protein